MRRSGRKTGQALRSPSTISGSTGVPVLLVAFQGEPGAFSEEAARKLLGREVRTAPRPTFEALFAAVGPPRPAVDCILVPLENSLAGAIQRNYDLLLASGLRITGEVVLPIAHHLIGCPDARLKQIATVQSHPVALAQCERFFAANPHFARVAADDTAGSVREIVQRGDPTRAAIGGAYAASLYGGRILRRHVQDHRENYTRFVLAAPAPQSAGGSKPKANGLAARAGRKSSQPDKLSLVFELRHRPGALCRALEPFASRGLNLMKIESRPIPGRPWEYRFYVDVGLAPEHVANGSSGSFAISAALTELKRTTTRVHVLGLYLAARES